ncbi:uncharacterized protein ACR2FA_009083 [Aphomia sociella]
MLVRRWWWSRRRWYPALLVLCGAALYAATRLCAPVELISEAEFPQVRPAALAHMLADFSTHPLTERGSWSVEEESSNYTAWRYSVTYECGARCVGRAAVLALEPRHGHAAAHRVRVRHSYCTALPLLPWPQFCDQFLREQKSEKMFMSMNIESSESLYYSVGYIRRSGAAMSRMLRTMIYLVCDGGRAGETDTDTLVTSAPGGGGALVRERARARCSGAAAPLAALLQRCADARQLRARRALHLRLLRNALTG